MRALLQDDCYGLWRLFLFLSMICIQILKEDDKLWPQPDRVGRQVSSKETLKFLFLIWNCWICHLISSLNVDTYGLVKVFHQNKCKNNSCGLVDFDLQVVCSKNINTGDKYRRKSCLCKEMLDVESHDILLALNFQLSDVLWRFCVSCMYRMCIGFFKTWSFGLVVPPNTIKSVTYEDNRCWSFFSPLLSPTFFLVWFWDYLGLVKPCSWLTFCKFLKVTPTDVIPSLRG